MTQEALPRPRRQCRGAAPAARGQRGRGGVGDGVDRRGRGGLFAWSQWSIRGRHRATLVRHEVGRGRALTLGLSALAAAPALRSCGVRQTPGTAALVALRTLAPRVMARGLRAGAPAVALAAVAAAAQQHLRAAARAHEQAGGMLGQAVGSSEGKLPEAASPSRGHALRWTTKSGNATLAPHPLLACVGYGVRFSLPGKLAVAVPAYIRARRSFYLRWPRPTIRPRRWLCRFDPGPYVKRRSQTTSPWRLPCRAASKANSCPVQLRHPMEFNTAQCKTASSPPNKRGS